MTELRVSDKQLPGLYQSADKASRDAQRRYFVSLMIYLTTLVAAATVAFYASTSAMGAMLSALLFAASLAILVYLRVKRPDDIWYNGRAVAESVKTRAWRWMMRADPYQDAERLEVVSKEFLVDLKQILTQNRSLAAELCVEAYLEDAITEKMTSVRSMPVADRLALYRSDRVQDQANFYTRKAAFNRKRATRWFWISVVLHTIAVVMLLLRVRDPSLNLPVEVIATTAGAVLTWLQAKKHNELASSYSLTAHEIVIIKGEALSVQSEESLSDFVVNTESAFSREHTQWAARKNE